MKLSAIVKTDWFGERVNLQVGRVRRRFLFGAGFAVRQRARRSLKFAKRKRESELTEDEAASYRRELVRFRMGLRSSEPQLPEWTAKPGEVPLLHQRPTSPLKGALVFALKPNGENVVVGPQRTKSSLERLEKLFPFMRPAMDRVRPEFGSLLKKAANR